MNILRSWSSFISNISVRGKLNLLTVIIAVGVIALAVIAARMQYLDLYETRKASLQSDVELTYGVLDHYVERVADGTLPLDRAQAEAIAALETMRAKDDSSYFNIYSTDYVVLMHPFRKDLLGKDMKDFRSEDGVRLYHDQVEAAKAGGGYVGYEWAKPGQDKPVPKLAYAGMYKPWNWVVSTGVYMDDVQTQALRFTGIMTLAGGVLVLLVFGLSWVIGSRIVLPLRRATTVADAIAGGRLDNAIAQTSRDEPGQLLGSMQRMQAQLQAVIAAQQEMERQHEAGIISYRMDQAA
ncbi:HAMP domain-containing protein, partial [Stenotrophomonas sp. MYb238]|uniref:cache domain-containing protein n=1 Tax=Stenotrophomonas sp. MYb238 TaxID=2040281 RepID=UPI001291FF86